MIRFLQYEGIRVPNQKEIHLQTLTIVSADGTPRMRLTTDRTHGLPYIEFLGDDDGRRLCFGVNPGNSPYLCMYRKDETAAAGMGFGPNGEPGITAYYPNGLPAVRICLSDTGNVEIELIDKSDQIHRFQIPNPPPNSQQPS